MPPSYCHHSVKETILSTDIADLLYALERDLTHALNVVESAAIGVQGVIDDASQTLRHHQTRTRSPGNRTAS